MKSWETLLAPSRLVLCPLFPSPFLCLNTERLLWPLSVSPSSTQIGRCFQEERRLVVELSYFPSLGNRGPTLPIFQCLKIQAS